MALADSSQEDEEKEKIAQKVLELEENTQIDLKYEKMSIGDVFEEDCETLSLSKFVKQESKLMFDILSFDKVKREWLKLPPKHWKLIS